MSAWFVPLSRIYSRYFVRPYNYICCYISINMNFSGYIDKKIKSSYFYDKLNLIVSVMFMLNKYFPVNCTYTTTLYIISNFCKLQITVLKQSQKKLAVETRIVHSTIGVRQRWTLTSI